MITIADTGFIVAIENLSDRHRQACLAIYQNANYIYTPQSVLNGVCFFLRQTAGNRGVARFLRHLPDTKYVLTSLNPWDIGRTAALLEHYADSRIDFVDATVTAIAERLRISTVLTLDRRDFEIVRPTHVAHFEILP